MFKSVALTLGQQQHPDDDKYARHIPTGFTKDIGNG